jgi:transglutaminase-like putative cysteine protease
MVFKSEILLRESKLLDFSNKDIQALIHNRGWNELDSYHKIKESYNFVKDEIKFGYNTTDALPASVIFKDGYGQCNTKAILFMALLRALGIKCRFHGFTINKRLQKGAITGITYLLTPNDIIHSWVEIYYNDSWINIEGFILDHKYLKKLQEKFPDKNVFYGYGVASNNLNNPEVEWTGTDTYIQKEGINNDLGIYNSPDDFFKTHNQALSPIKKFIYTHIARHFMNRNISNIRNGH